MFWKTTFQAANEDLLTQLCYSETSSRSEIRSSGFSLALTISNYVKRVRDVYNCKNGTISIFYGFLGRMNDKPHFETTLKTTK